MKKNIIARTMGLVLSAVFVMLITSATVHAGPVVTQTFNFHPGWNAIFLEVEPQEQDMEVLLQGLPLSGIWTWVPRGVPMQYVQDPNEKLLGSQGWHVYLPKSRGEEHMLSNLFALQPNRAYLIEINGTSNITWNITGRPSLRRQSWEPDSFNFTGFSLDSSNVPTFTAFFQGSVAHTGMVIYRLNDSGIWEPIQNPSTTAMRPGEAFWIYTEGTSKFTGPVAVRTDFGDGFDFRKTLTANKLLLRNVSSSAKTATVRYIPMSSPVPLVKRLVSSSGAITWPDFNAEETVSINAGKEKFLNFGLKRSALSVQMTESIIEVLDSTGGRYLVPVSAEKGGF